MGRKVNVDLGSFTQRQMLLVGGGLLVILAVGIGGVFLLADRQSNRDSEAAAELTAPVTNTASPTSSPVVTPSNTLPPTETPTLEPYSYTVGSGETLLFILQQFGYRDLAVIPELLVLNGMANENDLFEGQILLIPRQTPTPGPTETLPASGGDEGGAPADTAPSDGGGGDVAGDFKGCGIENKCVSPDGQFWMHEVLEGQTPAGIAYAYDTRVDDLMADNGNPEFIVPGQILKVRILVSPTPTLTPTGAPDSTATPTPTLSPPSLLAPVNSSTVARSEDVVLQWLPFQPLKSGQYYLIVLTDIDSGEEFRDTTRATVYRLPEALRPGSGSTIVYQWQVVIVNGAGTNSPVVGGQGSSSVFTWGN